ncbi:MAG TPA: lysyl oxidase family protein [Candidatus Polarisedimenticolia bacterium]|nr:lysyl oxidase family protein [Candidatus Polarisedimenticolia bacterium]
MRLSFRVLRAGSLPLLVCVLVFAVLTTPVTAQTESCQTVWPCTDPDGCPDFYVSAVVLASQEFGLTIYDFMSFTETDCAFVNGFVSGTGTRELLIFFTRLGNMGPGAFQIGSRFDNPDLFTPNTCHDHYHIKNMVDYRLWAVEGYQAWSAARAAEPNLCASEVLATHPELRAGLLVDGGKRGFCLTDFGTISTKHDGFKCPNKKDRAVYSDCDVQGLGSCRTEGYPPGVIGQWLDITGVAPDGEYVLENEVNPLRRFAEANVQNNSSAVLIRRTGTLVEPLQILAHP